MTDTGNRAGWERQVLQGREPRTTPQPACCPAPKFTHGDFLRDRQSKPPAGLFFIGNVAQIPAQQNMKRATIDQRADQRKTHCERSPLFLYFGSTGTTDAQRTQKKRLLPAIRQECTKLQPNCARIVESWRYYIRAWNPCISNGSVLSITCAFLLFMV